MTVSLFPLGDIAATPGALEILEHLLISPDDLLARHVSGDFGDLSQHDLDANMLALEHGDRLLSVYNIGKEKFYVITEADRSVTTILLPSEY